MQGKPKQVLQISLFLANTHLGDAKQPQLACIHSEYSVQFIHNIYYQWLQKNRSNCRNCGHLHAGAQNNQERG